MNIDPYEFINIITAIVAVIKFGYKLNNIALLIYFVIIFEVCFSYFYAKHYGNNVIPYNIFANGCIVFYFHYYFKVLPDRKNKKLFLYLFMAWLVFWMYNISNYSNASIDSLTYIFRFGLGLRGYGDWP